MCFGHAHWCTTHGPALLMWENYKQYSAKEWAEIDKYIVTITGGSAVAQIFLNKL